MLKLKSNTANKLKRQEKGEGVCLCVCVCVCVCVGGGGVFEFKRAPQLMKCVCHMSMWSISPFEVKLCAKTPHVVLSLLLLQNALIIKTTTNKQVKSSVRR